MTDPLDSIELVRRFQGGEKEALGALLERHLPGLRGYVRLNSNRELRSKEDSTDLVQSVCREVLEHADRFQHPGENAFRHWLYATALRKIRKRYRYYRAQKRDVGREIAMGETNENASRAPRPVSYDAFGSPSEHAVARESRERIEAAFDALSDEYREVLILARIVGLSRAEIGEKMGRKEQAVRSLLFRAQAKLSSLLAERGEKTEE